MALDVAAEVLAIDNLMGAYAMVSDTGFGAAGYQPLWCEACVVTVNNQSGSPHDPTPGELIRLEGRESVVRVLSSLVGTVKWAFHQFVRESLTFEPESDRAFARWSLTGLNTTAGPSGNVAMIATGRYSCELVKTDGQWRFQSMDIVTYQISGWQDGWVEREDNRGDH